MSSQGQYRDEKLWKEKRCHIAEQHEASTICEERIVSQIVNNLKEVDCRKGIYRRQIKPSLVFSSITTEARSLTDLYFFLYKSCCKILSKPFWSFNKRIQNCIKQLGFEIPHKSWLSNVAQLAFVVYIIKLTQTAQFKHHLNKSIWI